VSPDDRPTPLELLLPSGFSRRSLVLGSACPPALRPPEPQSASVDEYELVVVAPTRREADDPAWLADAARTAAASLEADGVVYVLAPPHARRRLRRLLASGGLRTGEAFLHIPDVTRSRAIVPVRRELLSYALEQLVPLKKRNRTLLSLLLRCRAERTLAALASPVGVAIRRAESRSLFDWLFTGAATGTAVLLRSPRGLAGGVALQLFSPSSKTPSAVAKLPVEGRSPEQLASHLDTHAASAATAGAAIPRAVATSLGSRPVLLETPVSGANAALLLARTPRRLPEILAALVQWLDAWQAITAREGALDRDRLEQWILAPAARLEPRIHGGGTYRRRLEHLCEALEGTALPHVAVHGDLTMSNVLVADPPAPIGIVDWESATTQGLPLLDLHYAVADAAAAVRGYTDRAAAARDCFSPGGALAERVKAAQARLAHTLDLTNEVAALCFHACWLHHADNEQRSLPTDGQMPFFEILDWVAGAEELPEELALPAALERRP